MSQENVEAVKRGLDAYNRRDVEALLEKLEPKVEWHSALLASLGGEATVYRQGVREMLGDVYDALAEIYTEYSEIRDLGDRIVAARWGHLDDIHGGSGDSVILAD